MGLRLLNLRCAKPNQPDERYILVLGTLDLAPDLTGKG
ncbi:hypothetical protein GXM_01066 [Nostoc sphaeroides CCNUC1]|uniref:Uncharacterized protein n=1 Tax=Nostoc sphaeroides CCNUC1 TaxID=2653204 RepID=A0A5P8VT69_9NOSO|nr:hypothetical protein GXM_01066 [Nostoc sphaeroides CCNUC1]